MTDYAPTDEELAQWLYDAEYDWDTDDYDSALPIDTFPRYYEDCYRPTLAAIFRELIEARAKIAALPTPSADIIACAEEQASLIREQRDRTYAEVEAGRYKQSPELDRRTADLRVAVAVAAVERARKGWT